MQKISKRERNAQFAGSVHHPELAQKSEAITKEELDELKKEKNHKEQDKNKVNEDIASINAQINTLLKDLKIDISKENITDYIAKVNEQYEVQEKNISSKLDEANKLYINITEEKLHINEFDYDSFKSKFDSQKKLVEDIITSDNAIIDGFTKKMKKDLSDKTDIKEYAEDINKQYADLSKSFEELCQTIKTLYYEITEEILDIDEFDFNELKEKYDDTKKEHTKKITECNTKKDEFSKNIDLKKKEQEKIKSEYENAYKILGFKNEQNYKENILDEAVIESTKKMIEDYKQQCTETLAQIKELKEQLKDKEKINLEKDKEEFETLKNYMDKIKQLQIEITSKYSNNMDILSSLKKNSDEIIKQTELYAILDDLYKTASGNLAGKNKIEFEQYVQSVYFDMILVEANKRLTKMTNDRFRLMRKTKATNLGQNIGLDLEVFDNYTGKQRDVKSLSGGESFKAALSLSLGVSDVIQSYSGGVTVDTLFIDEGFGSLDTESREQAIDTLDLLTSNNKLIGIISHVTELKERIDKKIIIKKTSNGSEIGFEGSTITG